jgi:TonB family protein
MKHLIFITLSFMCARSFAQPEAPGKSEPKKDTGFVCMLPVYSLPEFPMGDTAMGSFIKRNINIPEKVNELGISGTVYIEYLVDGSGSISEVRVIKGISGCPECDREALHVVQMMPPWKPGNNPAQGTVRFILPIKFGPRPKEINTAPE